MEARPFAGFNPRPSAWGYNWTTENASPADYRGSPASSSQNSPASNPTASSSPEPQTMLANQQYANMPAALLTSLKREKKPFTYTPGGVNLSEVLNARLQKRMERKKKYVEEHLNEEKNPIERLPKFEPPKQLIVMPTYNSPLDMYSMENALEALEVQAELVAADKSLSSPSRSATLPRNHKFVEQDSNKGVAQSKAFKVLQIITDTEEDALGKGKGIHYQDEKRFTGIRDSKTIPSKFFQTLQKITGTDENDEQEDASFEAERVTFEKQTHRPAGFPQQQNIPPPPMQLLSQLKSSCCQHKTVTFQEPVTNNSSSVLKRPAAFLPMNTVGDPLTRVKPVHPPFLTNGRGKGCNP